MGPRSCSQALVGLAHEPGQITGSDGRTYTVFWNVANDVPVTGTKTVRLFVYWDDSKFGLNKVITTTVLGGFYL